jgi:hypothetical protein
MENKIVYDDLQDLLQAIIPPGYGKPEETTDEINTRFVKSLWDY